VRWLITGAGGQLGHHLIARLGAVGEDVVGTTRAEFDITDDGATRRVVGDVGPDIVINAAGYTAVDAAETDEAAALAVNGDGPANLAAVLREYGGRLVHVSTDYVFAGTLDRPYEPTDPVDPRTAYGRTKLAGEHAVRTALPDRSWVVRTAWVHGGPGPNFVSTMVKLEAERDTLDVVADQIGSPTWVGDLAGALIELAQSEAGPGITHFTNAGQASWYELARAVFELRGADPDRVRPTTTDKYPRPAPRPAWSVLSTKTWTESGLTPPRDWRAALADSLR
jgi:dTDP-4-dehydrorhamnose reductase